MSRIDEFSFISLHGVYDFRTDKDASTFGAICIVVAAYGGDIPVRKPTSCSMILISSTIV